MARIKITGSGLHGEIAVNGAKVPEVMSADLCMRAGSLATLSLEIAASPVEVEAEGEVRITSTAQPEHIERASPVPERQVRR
ncbi:hypothetical protein [Melaminivora sp.]|uniref:hypothetical protein n=1 Tax=Melaminivora sp. TaxID=1933032 RepID=UPI0028AECF10|nr:hypothetical protein [Melaminivora sp.]